MNVGSISESQHNIWLAKFALEFIRSFDKRIIFSNFEDPFASNVNVVV